MTARDVHLPVADHPIDDVADLARRAERLGYDRVWQPETWGRDAVTALSAIAERTDRIGVGASVLNVFSRSPALLGQTAASLQELSGGRFRLGIGPSGPILVEGWHGTEFDRPLRRTREAVEIVRAVLAGDAVEYDGGSASGASGASSGEETESDGGVFRLSGFRLRSDPPDAPPPVDVAAMGPTGVELAGRFADGWHAIVQTPEGIRERLADLERGADLGGRDVEDVRVTLSVTCCVAENPEHARDLVREHLAFYVGGMGTYYRDALARQGHGERANGIAAAWGSGDRDRAADLVTEDLLDDLAVAGDRERARESLDRFAAIDGVDAVAVGFPRGASRQRMQDTLHALAPE